MTKTSGWHFDDFTESHYRDLLKVAKCKWKFISVTEYKKEGRKILWRHDLDCSVHRAFKLAQIEAEEGVKAIYFIHLHNILYNALEKEIANLIFKIIDLGHDLGLHFDPAFYAEHKGKGVLGEGLIFEKNILEKVFLRNITAFSFHNPEKDNLAMKSDEIGGMINVYGRYFKENFGFCSDSNGYWRFHRLKDVLEAGEDENLQVLTHPGWWQKTPMSPRERITRCIEGRAKKQRFSYDKWLGEYGRKNIGK